MFVPIWLVLLQICVFDLSLSSHSNGAVQIRVGLELAEELLWQTRAHFWLKSSGIAKPSRLTSYGSETDKTTEYLGPNKKGCCVFREVVCVLFGCSSVFSSHLIRKLPIRSHLLPRKLMNQARSLPLSLSVYTSLSSLVYRRSLES